MPLKYLITGATGGLGEKVLAYFVANRPASEFAAASSRESNRKQFEDRGIAFRHANYDDPVCLESAFQDVENLLFVSTNVFDNEKRQKQHENFINAAKKVGVKHVCNSFPFLSSSTLIESFLSNILFQVWYTSLAFGGLESTSKAAVQQVHLITEDLLKK